MDDLVFDPIMEPDTTLAEIYMKEHKHFQDSPKRGRCFIFNNGSDMVDEDLSILSYPVKLQPDKTVHINYEIRRKFNIKLKEKEELFCQLEYLIRKTDVEDTKKQLKLILQYLECYDACWDTDSPLYTLLTTEDTPMYCLGYLISAIYSGKKLRLLTTMKTSPLCYLFYEVCFQAGINVPLLYINEEDVVNFEKISTKSKKGCTAVFTEHADIPSAVDVFLNSSTRAPWRIDRILVQESVMDDVTSAFSAYGKGRRMEADRPRQYVAAFETRRGTVAVTVGGVSVGEDSVVSVSMYRTVSDLVSLLSAEQPRFLSLWCAETAPAYEIAAAAAAPYIWVNGYADFDGPPEIALAVYDAPLYYVSLDPDSYAYLQQLWTKWCRLSPYQRKAVLLKTIARFQLESGSQIDYEWIADWKPKDLAQMGNNKLTTVTDVPQQKVIYIKNDQNITAALDLILRGYCVYVNISTKSTENLILEMNKELIPITSRQRLERDSDIKVPKKAHRGNKKVVQQTYGTIYAN